MSKGDNKQVDAITSKALDDLFEDKPKVKPKKTSYSSDTYWRDTPSRGSGPSYWDYGSRDMFGRASDYEYDNEPYDWSKHTTASTTKTSTTKSTYGYTLEQTLLDDIEDNSRNGRLEVDPALLEDFVDYALQSIDNSFRNLDVWIDGGKHADHLRAFLKGALEEGDLEKTGGRSLSIIVNTKEEK